MSKYTSLSRAQLSFEYLHTNSTTHEFLFGALAELLDNSRDAAATKVSIYTVSREDLRGSCMLCVLDDGDGMDPDEVCSVMKFGSSCKKSGESNMIGQYGNGLKSGSMRIGKDFILFTKKESSMSCLMLSRTFHETESLNEVLIPMPSWNRQTRLPLPAHDDDREKHAVEMDLILKYSPFNTKKQLFEQFDKIDSDTGTLVVIYNLKTLDNGESEIDIKTDPQDILLTQMDYEKEYEDEREHFEIPEKKSFRAYTAVLYQEPRMRIYVQNSKVRTKRLETLSYLPRQYEYSSARFKARSEKETFEAENRCKLAEERAREAESDARNLERRLGDGGTKEERMELRVTQRHAVDCRRDCEVLKKLAERKRKSLKEPKTLKFTFGLNIQNRKCFGMFVYNCSRLIKMYERVGPQLEGGSSGVGVIGVVNVPYLVLEPTHNKQDFADAKEYRHLLRALGEHLHHYWQICGVVDPRTGSGVRNFWAEFGYFTNKWTEEPSQESKYIKKRMIKTTQWMQCDRCLKWRVLPFSHANFKVSESLSDEWTCHQNSDVNYNKCMIAEHQVKIPLANITQRPFEEKTQKKSTLSSLESTASREKKKSGEDRGRKGAAEESVPLSKKKRSISPIVVSRTPETAKKSSSKLVAKSTPKPPKEITGGSRSSLSKESQKIASKNGSLPLGFDKDEYKRLKEKYSGLVKKKPIIQLRDDDDDDEEEEEEEEDQLFLKKKKELKKSNGVSSSGHKRSLSPSRDHPLKKAKDAGLNNHSDIMSSNNLPTQEKESSREYINLKKIQDKLAESLRLCLHYFSPPSWPTKKEDLINLDLDKLLDFPLNKFFDTYEVNLTELIAQYQEHSSDAEKKAESTEEKLTNLRKLVMQLLKPSLKFETDTEVNTEEVGDNVDEILAAVVKESTKSQPSDVTADSPSS